MTRSRWRPTPSRFRGDGRRFAWRSTRRSPASTAVTPSSISTTAGSAGSPPRAPSCASCIPWAPSRTKAVRQGTRGRGGGLTQSPESGGWFAHDERMSGKSSPGNTPPASVSPLVEGLRDSLFRNFVETVGDYAIFVVDPEGRVVTWNRGAQRIKGYSTAEI